MKAYLPSATQPWSQRIERRHEPKSRIYSSFKSCLRWEFGFSCAFCLLHEADLMPMGTSGWAIMQIEHSIARSRSPLLSGAYANCFYICERCNKSRGASPNQDEEANVLLDPCAVAWADHFERVGDEIRPRPGDGSARYTWESYDLDDPSKVTIRKRRRVWIESHVAALHEILAFRPELFERMIESSESSTAEELLNMLDAARGLDKAWQLLLDNLSHFKPIPRDQGPCRCRLKQACSLPAVLAEQTVNLLDLLDQVEARPSSSRS